MAHERFADRGIVVAGVNPEPIETNLEWAKRLALPFPLLSDTERLAGNAFRVLRRIGIGPWHVDLYRRSTFLIDAQGLVAAVWGNVKVRGHAAQVLVAADALQHGG